MERKTYEIIERQITYYLSRTKFKCLLFSREQTLEDLSQEVFCSILAKGAVEKYDGQTSEAYYYSLVVKRILINMVTRNVANKRSLERETTLMEEDTPIVDKASLSTADKICINVDVDRMLDKLPKRAIGKNTGYSPVLGKCTLSYYTLVYHLRAGYSIKELTEVFPKVSTRRFYQIASEIKDYIRINFGNYALAM